MKFDLDANDAKFLKLSKRDRAFILFFCSNCSLSTANFARMIYQGKLSESAIEYLISAFVDDAFDSGYSAGGNSSGWQ
jgi:hypothetical protein